MQNVSTYWFCINCIVNALLPTPPAINKKNDKKWEYKQNSKPKWSFGALLLISAKPW